MISSLRKLADGENLVNEIAREAAPLLDSTIKSTAKAGTTPDGAPWAPLKHGGPALQGAEGAITTKSYGPVIRSTLTGGYVYAHIGARGPKRQVLPSGGAAIPPQALQAIEAAATKVFDRVVGK